jgi:hypothetical protein
MEETYKEQVFQALKNMGAAPVVSAPVRSVAQSAAALTATGKSGAKQEYGRNDKVTITNGAETQEMKYKKAEPLLAQGWRIVS